MVMAETVPAETVEMTEVRDARILRKKRSVMNSFSEVSLSEFVFLFIVTSKKKYIFF